MFRTDCIGNAYYASDDRTKPVLEDIELVSPNGELSMQCLNIQSQSSSQAENILLSKELRANKPAPDFLAGIYKYDCCTLCRRTFGPRDRTISCTLCGTLHCLRCGQCPLPEGWSTHIVYDKVKGLDDPRDVDIDDDRPTDIGM